VSCGKKLPEPDPRIPIVVFDLDSTLATTTWPERYTIGPPIPEGVALLKHYAEQGYRIEILTARPHIDHGLIWHWIHQHKLPVDAVNCGKPFGGLYVDDRAYRPEYTVKREPEPQPEEEEWDEEEITRIGRS